MEYSNKGKEQLFEELRLHHSRFLDMDADRQSLNSRPQDETTNLDNSFYISQKKYLIDDEQQYNTELSRLYNKKVLTTLRNRYNVPVVQKDKDRVIGNMESTVQIQNYFSNDILVKNSFKQEEEQPAQIMNHQLNFHRKRD